MFILAAAMIVAGVALFVAAPLGIGLVGARAKSAGELQTERHEHERALAVQGLRELEFDREMGKLSDADYDSMHKALEDRALTAMAAIERIRDDARRIGPATAALCELILESRPHPEQGFRACLGIVRLAGPHGAERLEAAAERAIDIGARTYGSVKSILDNNLDRRPARQRATDGTPILHANIRGPRYYN